MARLSRMHNRPNQIVIKNRHIFLDFRFKKLFISLQIHFQQIQSFTKGKFHLQKCNTVNTSKTITNKLQEKMRHNEPYKLIYIMVTSSLHWSISLSFGLFLYNGVYRPFSIPCWSKARFPNE